MKILPEPGWNRLLKELEVQPGTVLLLGATDSGKSTLARYMVEFLAKRRLSTALIDADIGQSGICLPGTIGMKVFRDQRDLGKFRCRRMTFLGFTSPARVIPLMIAMTERLTSIGRRSARTIVVDTTGLISGELGKSLKMAKIRAIQPDHVVALQREDELQHILSFIDTAKIHRFEISRAARKRSASARRKYRRRKLADYFRQQALFAHLLDISSLPLFYRGRMFRYGDKEMPQGGIVGLNRNEDTAALGMITTAAETAVFFTSPLRSLRGINRVVCGDMILSLDER